MEYSFIDGCSYNTVSENIEFRMIDADGDSAVSKHRIKRSLYTANSQILLKWNHIRIYIIL